MLIKSSFSDYYDGVAAMGIDRSICYLRYPKEVTTDRFQLDRFPRYFPDDLDDNYRCSESDIERWNLKKPCEFYIVGFCGTYIVGLTDLNRSTVYYGEEILKLNWRSSFHYRGDLQQVEYLVNRFHGERDDSLFQELAAPIFIVKLDYNSSQSQINPCLNKLQFYRYQDAYSAFQSIAGYISGVLGTTLRPLIEISNDSKITKAGFDLKTSFRKRKQQEK
jgi:hypothetical protein